MIRMTTNHTTPTPFLPIPAPAARIGTAAGATLALIGTFLAWTWTDQFPGDLTVTGYPGGLQVLTLISAALTLLLTLSGYGIRGLRWLTPGGTNSPVRLLALGTLGTTGYTIGAIAYDLGGIVNLEPGAWVSGIGALIAAITALGLPSDQPHTDTRATAWQRFRNSLAAPQAPAPKPSPPGPKSSSSSPRSASASTSSPTASTPTTPNSSSASSSPPASPSPHSTEPDSSPASPR